MKTQEQKAKKKKKNQQTVIYLSLAKEQLSSFQTGCASGSERKALLGQHQILVTSQTSRVTFSKTSELNHAQREAISCRELRHVCACSTQRRAQTLVRRPARFLTRRSTKANSARALQICKGSARHASTFHD
jgi:hypothetical protein